MSAYGVMNKEHYTEIVREKKMNRKSLLKLVKTLNSEKRNYSSAECAEILDMGVSTFKSRMKEINSELRRNGALIESKSGKGNGYTLRIFDRKTFDRYLKEILPEQAKKERPDFTSREKRIRYLTIRFLEKDCFHKSDDLAESLGLSRTQLSNDLAMVRQELGSYGIELKSVPGSGLHAVGEEGRIRACLANALMKNERSHLPVEDDQNLYPQSVLYRIHYILRDFFKETHYQLTAENIDSLGISLVVQYYRIKEGCRIVYGEETIREIKALPDHAFAGRLAERISKELRISFDESEICYMTIYLNTRSFSLLEVNSPEADDLVSEMLDRLVRIRAIDLRDDEHYQQMLRLHTAELLKRIRFGTKMSHPLVTDVSIKLLEAYDTAAVFASVIYERYGYLLSEEETGYYALHTEIALDRRRVNQKNILLINADTRSNTELLRYSFEKKFHDQVRRLDICDVIDLKKRNLGEYDAVFSTVDMPVSPAGIRMPVYRISALISGKEKDLVRKVLSSEAIMDSQGIDFRPELFFDDIDASDRGKVIHEMCGRIAAVESVPEGFEDSLVVREQYGRTVFPAGAVFLRSLERTGEKTILSAAVFSHPVDWNGEKIQMVLIGSFSRTDTKSCSGLLKALSIFLNDRKLVSGAISACSYGSLTEILNNCSY